MARLLKFQSPEELQRKIDNYFNQCDSHAEEVTEWVQARDPKGQLKKDENGLNYLVEVTHKIMTEQIPYTITGLALALDTSRQTLLEYEAEEHYPDNIPKEVSDELIDTIKRAKLKIERFNELMLYTPSPTGTIFNLKNNYGWKDKTEQDLNLGGQVKTALVRFDGEDEPREE